MDQASELEALLLDNTGLESMQGVGNAQSLVELSLGSNQLLGPTQEELSRLINIETLVLSHNKLNGYVPAGSKDCYLLPSWMPCTTSLKDRSMTLYPWINSSIWI